MQVPIVIVHRNDNNTVKKLIKEQETGPGLKRKLVWTLERHCRGQLRSFYGTWPNVHFMLNTSSSYIVLSIKGPNCSSTIKLLKNVYFFIIQKGCQFWARIRLIASRPLARCKSVISEVQRFFSAPRLMSVLYAIENWYGDTWDSSQRFYIGLHDLIRPTIYLGAH